MDPQNLNVCQICKKEPAVYGDGLTWARCSKCEYEFRKENPQPQDQQVTEDGFPHKKIKDLVSIIMPVYMVNYPLFHYTGTAIGSVRSHSKKGTYELIIVDNGSPIKPPNMNSYYAHKIVTNEKNMGVSKAWNQGIRVSFGEYIVLLNNDTQVYEHWMEDMKKCLDEGGLDLVMATPMYSLTEPFARWVESEQIRDRWQDKPITESFSDFKDFSCVMFKKDLMDEVGMFDEQFFSYASDSDLFKRMDQAGKKYASTKAVAIHHIIDATGASIPETPEIMNEDKARFEEKWSSFAKATEDEKGGEKVVDLSNFTIEDLEAELEARKNQPTLNLVNTNETGDKIFLIKDEQTHWVKNPETLQALGGGFGQVKKLTKEEFSVFTKGEDLDMENVEQYK